MPNRPHPSEGQSYVEATPSFIVNGELRVDVLSPWHVTRPYDGDLVARAS